MAALQPLFSGSSGNAVLVESKKSALLVDAGVSARRIISGLALHGKSADEISGIVITHEHIDHIKAVGSLAAKYCIPVYANEKTFSAMDEVIGKIPSSLRRIVSTGESFFVDDIEASAFSVPHDAADPVGFVFKVDGKKVTVATDIGGMSEKLFLSLSGSAEILLESNYDTVMLQKGPYPMHLKKRIAGPFGHLSNREAAITCARLVSLGTKRIILGHLSRENNTPELCLEMAKHYIEECGVSSFDDISLAVAPRSSI